MPEEPESYHWNERAAVLVNHAIVAAMMVCISYTILQLAHRLFPDWSGAYLPLLCLLVSLEAMLSWRKTRRWADVNLYGFAYWVVEWVVLIVLIKLFLYLWNGAGQILVDIPRWAEDFMANFFNSELLFAGLVSLVIWFLSGMYARDLLQLEGDEKILKFRDMEGYISDRGSARRALVSRVFMVGFIITLITALVHLDYETFQRIPLIRPADLLNVILYFILSLVLFSQTHFAILRAAWAWDRYPVVSGMTRRWTIFSLIFLCIVGAAAFLLPTRYSLGLLSTLNMLVTILGSALYVLLFLVTLPIIAIFNLILSLFGKQEVANQLPPPQLPKPIAPAPGAPVPWLDILKSVLFWIMLLTVVGYAFYQYLRQNQELLERLKRVPVLSWLIDAWQLILASLKGLNQQLGSAARQQLRRMRSRTAEGLARTAPGFIHLMRLTPRQRILFFYLAMIRRGGESGFPRKPSQTPYEYVETLSPNLPDAQEDIHAMTETFLEARYSRHEITPEHVNLVKAYWERVRRAFRSWRNNKAQAGDQSKYN